MDSLTTWFTFWKKFQLCAKIAAAAVHLMKLSGCTSAKYRANRFDIAVCVTGNDVSTIDTQCCDAMRQPADARLRRKTRFCWGFFDDGAGWRRKTLIFPRSWWRCAPLTAGNSADLWRWQRGTWSWKHRLFDARARSVSLVHDWKRLRHYFIRYPRIERATWQPVLIRFRFLITEARSDFLFIWQRFPCITDLVKIEKSIYFSGQKDYNFKRI